MSSAAFITGKVKSIAKRSKRSAPKKKKPVARGFVTSYNAEQRGKNPQESKLDEMARHLMPLRSGKSVVLAMELPPRKGVKKVAKAKPKLVVIAPGQLHGFKRDRLLVSIDGMGAALIKLNDPTSVAKLVLARMPARLARELMNQIHQVFQEK